MEGSDGGDGPVEHQEQDAVVSDLEETPIVGGGADEIDGSMVGMMGSAEAVGEEGSCDGYGGCGGSDSL